MRAGARSRPAGDAGLAAAEALFALWRRPGSGYHPARIDHEVAAREPPMCRNIRTRFNFEPPATEEEIRASSVQFVRKLSGFAHPSKANEAAFERAVDEVAAAARRLLNSLDTASPPRDR